MDLKSKILQIPLLRTIYESLHPEGRVVDIFRPHLGGYKPGGNPATDAVSLFEEFYDRFGCRAALDVGCAEGIMVDAMLRIGYDAYGMEGLAKAL
jgi:hypothetical protein